MSAPSEPHESLFYEALELPVPDRTRFLDEACGGNPELRAEVEELLRAHDGAAGFLPQDGPDSPDVEGAPGHVQPERPGDRIGPYKLLEQIGEGGFGVVWVAEQEKPVRRRVALKIIKPGMDSKEVIARFEQERQALAMMDHPNIARVLDAGATSLGRPYFVMELVKGVKITQYCDQANLPTRERLRIFLAVCHAVQHAHQKGIIHRDLKPSNILVTLHDGVPVPKVIDFGIAKATQQQRLTDLTIYTRFEQMVGTPLYMAPEQAEMSGLDIDTRSDIYSLGVLLYELLVGRTPFDPETLMKRGLDEIRRVVREQEPQKPSTFVSTMALDLRTTVAQHRQTDGTKLIGQIRGDLDWIVMKALEKDRARRYETANNLAEDIQRHLVSEPIQARPATQLYRFRRFAKRNKIAFAAGTGIAAALLIGLAVSTWMFFKEKQARGQAVAAEQKASTEAGKSRQVAQFLKDMLNGVEPSVAQGRDTTMLREILDKTAERVGKDLKDQPEVEAELRATMGNLFFALGQYDRAAEFHREALAIRRKIFGNEHPDVAASLRELGDALGEQGRLPEAETMLRESLELVRKLYANEAGAVGVSLNSLAAVLIAQRKLDEAETMLRESLEIKNKLFGNDHPEIASAFCNLAVVLQNQRKFTEAETLQRKALEISRRVYGSDHPELAFPLSNLAVFLHDKGKFDEAETLQREALALRRKFLGPDHEQLAVSLGSLGSILRHLGQQAEAEVFCREELGMRRKQFGTEHPKVATSLYSLAELLGDQGRRLAEAEAMHREALEMRRKLPGSDNRNVAASLHSLAITVIKQHRPAEAENLFREAAAILRKLADPEVVISLEFVAGMLRDQGKPAEEETVRREVLEIARAAPPADPEKILTAILPLAEVLYHQGKFAEAEPLYREALENRRSRLAAGHPDVVATKAKLGRLLGDWAWRERGSTTGNQDAKSKNEERAREAESLLRDCLEFARMSAATDPAKVVSAILPLVEVVYRQGKFAEAEPLYREALENRRARLEAGHHDVLASMASLARLLGDWAWRERGSTIRNQDAKSKNAARAREAESLLRECLATRLLGPEAGHWRTNGDVPSRLGGALVTVAFTDPSLTPKLRLAKLTEAEKLLLQGNEVMQNGDGVDRKYHRDGLVRLVQLYEAWEKPDQAAAWKRKLADFDKAGGPTEAGPTDDPAQK